MKSADSVVRNDHFQLKFVYILLKTENLAITWNSQNNPKSQSLSAAKGKLERPRTVKMEVGLWYSLYSPTQKNYYLG